MAGRHRISSLFIVIYASIQSYWSYAETLYIQPPRALEDASHSYYRDLLSAQLASSDQLSTIERPVTQERSMQLLNSGDLTVTWSGTSYRRENLYRPVRVPLFLGLLGVRVPVIRRSDIDLFDKITEEKQLQTLVACQGDQWPDSDILERNHYTVERVAKFESMYRMLKGGRCDYFPRSIIEVYGELEAPDRSDLIVYERLLLSYTFPMYYFMSYEREALAKSLESSLYDFATSGKLLEFMKTHPATRPAFPLSRFRESTIFYLHNPDLPTETPISDTALWLMPGQNSNEDLQAIHLFE
ncbi:hypothetical protein SAMN05421686_1178 [Thalassolituus maritimus]|uniref:Extracellular solute-binding protein, family 3 n=1 Tax=Thalassolituus maritimus TaxID=484498 RepID=A0A1N7QA91_9GAMM|nr:hypothetical protein [Thalassolituus maritimus]SIT19714.1 hypothetical protein SAMN05421686_1178 [Thalassolituus maritimus]